MAVKRGKQSSQTKGKKNKGQGVTLKNKALPPTTKKVRANKETGKEQRAGGAFRKLAKGLVVLVLWIAAILFFSGGGYGFYRLYQDIGLVNEELSKQENELARLNQQRLVERLNETSLQLNSLRDEYLLLNEQLVFQEKATSLINNRLNDLEKEIPLLDVENLEQQRLGELIYLAEQHRQLGESPYPITRLLQQAYSIALTHSASLSLIEAINLDLAKYQTISTINRTRTLIELDDALKLVPQLPRLVEPSQITESPPNDYANNYKELLTSLGEYIRIYRIEGSTKFSLAREEARLLELTLVVRIMQAQLAVLQREEVFYRHTIESANELVQSYYPPSSLKSELINRLANLAEMTIKPEPLPPLHSAALLAR